jgi:hypothetical protein
MGFFGNKTTSENKKLFINAHEGSAPRGIFTRDVCQCFKEYYDREDAIHDAQDDAEIERLQGKELIWKESEFHKDALCLDDGAWSRVLDLIERSKKSGVEVLDLGRDLDPADYSKLRTLPPEIGKLTKLKKLVIYGSNISYLPREIGGCESLVEFTPYTSYRLHWFPFEITRCSNLKKSCVSTRAIYGNRKLRTPFPDLSRTAWDWGNQECSICGQRGDVTQYWISKVVATDVLPMLVSVCSDACLSKVGVGADGYLPTPHKGGLGLGQPKAEWM